MDPTGGGGTLADIVPIQIIFGVDPCTRCWDICQNAKIPHWLPPIVTKISFASFSAHCGPPTPELPHSRPWCLLYPEPKFHADRTILRWDILNRTNKQKTNKQKANLISRQALRYATLYGEIITTASRQTDRQTKSAGLTRPHQRLPALMRRPGSEALSALTMHTLCLPSLETVHRGSQTAAQTGPSTEISDTSTSPSSSTVSN